MAGRYAEALGSGLYGIDAAVVRIEVAIQNGIPSFEIVGLCGSDIKESRERVRAAVRSSGYEFPNGRITANFAPAWIHKQGTCFDLPLALALLCASGQVRPRAAPFLAFGELSLTGDVRGVNGAISRAGAASDAGIGTVVAPQENFREVAALRGIRVVPVATLREAAERLAREDPCGRAPDPAQDADEGDAGADGACGIAGPHLVEVRGQQAALRCLEIAAAGRHNLLLEGSPGSGKTLLASLLPHLMPELEEAEALEVTRIYSAAGLLEPGCGLLRNRPFRAPHPSATTAALIGGGGRPRPGEATLAHKGVLFLDEFSEFDGRTLDALRIPAEEGVVRLSRSAAQIVFPADFMLVGATNPCPCGRRLEDHGGCRCSPASVARHLARLGGPLLDRMDLRVEVKRVDASAMERTVRIDASSSVAEARARIRAAWVRQRERNGAPDGATAWNARIPGERLQERLGVDDAFIAQAAGLAHQRGASVRGFHRVLRVARTIADLDGAGRVGMANVLEAFIYRPLERKEREG